MPVPIETLRPEKYVGDARSAASGNGAAAEVGAWACGMDSTAADGAAVIPGGPGIGGSWQHVGYCVSAAGLVFALRVSTRYERLFGRARSHRKNLGHRGDSFAVDGT